MKRAILVPLTLGLAAVSSFADMDLSKVTYNTNDPMNVGLLVLGAVAVIWGIKKAISMANRG